MFCPVCLCWISPGLTPGPRTSLTTCPGTSMCMSHSSQIWEDFKKCSGQVGSRDVCCTSVNVYGPCKYFFLPSNYNLIDFTQVFTRLASKGTALKKLIFSSLTHQISHSCWGTRLFKRISHHVFITFFSCFLLGNNEPL